MMRVSPRFCLWKSDSELTCPFDARNGRTTLGTLDYRIRWSSHGPGRFPGNPAHRRSLLLGRLRVGSRHVSHEHLAEYQPCAVNERDVRSATDHDQPLRCPISSFSGASSNSRGTRHCEQVLGPIRSDDRRPEHSATTRLNWRLVRSDTIFVPFEYRTKPVQWPSTATEFTLRRQYIGCLGCERRGSSFLLGECWRDSDHGEPRVTAYRNTNVRLRGSPCRTPSNRCQLEHPPVIVVRSGFVVSSWSIAVARPIELTLWFPQRRRWYHPWTRNLGVSSHPTGAIKLFLCREWFLYFEPVQNRRSAIAG